MGYVCKTCWEENAMTLEEEIRLGLHGNHCKVIEDMLIETVRETRERTTNRIIWNMIEDGTFSLDEIAEGLKVPIEKVQELNRQREEYEMQEQELLRQIEELKKNLMKQMGGGLTYMPEAVYDFASHRIASHRRG